MSETEEDAVRLNTLTLSRLAVAIQYHIQSMSVIPMYPENDEARSMHEKMLLETLQEMREILNG